MTAMPHTADYMLYDDTEKMVSNFTVYNQTAGKPLKAIVIAVDHFEADRNRSNFWR